MRISLHGGFLRSLLGSRKTDEQMEKKNFTKSYNKEMEITNV
jgi:hypothetical protein